jgi:hypothetical protein
LDLDRLARELLGDLPYILFFDDFRDSFEERITIISKEHSRPTGWLAILEQLFKQTDSDFSVFSLEDMEERNRKSVIAKVKRHLNQTLTREWQTFRLDDSDALEISIEYETPSGSVEGEQGALKLEVIETDADGDQHYFFIRDRSKGFFWFFNFVMKLEFNPKVVSNSDGGTIYLLDEPGSYLHATAQSRLCHKLNELSKRNRVLFCTHSHYLLNPEVMPLNCIRVADKDGNGNVQLIPIHEHPGNISERRSAFQPVIDALEIKPFIMDLTFSQVVIVEGIVDYYALEMFKRGRNIGILPAVNADSIQYYVSLMIAWRVPFRALWDNDDEGRTARQRATKKFGEELAQDHFHMLPLRGPRARNTILQNLFDGDDLRKIKEELGLSRQSSFAATITSLYYSPIRFTILSKVSQRIIEKFDEVFDVLALS